MNISQKVKVADMWGSWYQKQYFKKTSKQILGIWTLWIVIIIFPRPQLSLGSSPSLGSLPSLGFDMKVCV